MHPLVQALLSPWDWRIDVTVTLLTLGTLYVTGWIRLRRRSNYRQLAKRRRLAAYLSGLATLALALMSPIDRLGGQLFFIHMIQHKLEIMVAAPLLCLANPFPFILWGLPAPLRRWVAGLFRLQSPIRDGLAKVTGPGLSWFIFIVFYMGWHDPTLYNWALVNSTVHDIQHLTFFGSAMLFWWHITSAAPRIHGRTEVWGRLAMLIGVIPAQMIAGVIIATSSEVIYTYYNSIPRFWGFSVLSDQAIAGMIMWTLSSEMIIWGAVFLLNSLFKKEPAGPVPTQQWDREEVMIAPGLEARARQNRWRKAAEARLQARHTV
jgi:putative membrane protein